MRNIYNKHCVCTVRCPWGCTEFIYKTGVLRLDYVIKKFFSQSKNIEIYYKNIDDAKNSTFLILKINILNVLDKII